MTIRPFSSAPLPAPAARPMAPEAKAPLQELDPRIAAIEPPPHLVDPPQPVGPLPRPVLLIAGGKSKDVGLPESIHYLTSGGNNKFAGVFGIDRKEELEREYRQNGGNVFTLRYSKAFNSFDQNAKEIKQAVDEIRRLTGADEIDVVAECKGAMEAREYLREGHDGIRNLVMFVPPNHGLTLGGDLLKGVARLLDRLNLPVESIAGYPMDKETLKALGSFSTDWSLGPLRGNKVLHALNTPENRARESEVLNSLTVISGKGKNLLAKQLGPGLPTPLNQGDHAIPTWSAFLSHADNFFYEGDRAHHGDVKSHPDALAKMAETLLSDGNPVKDEAFHESAPGIGQVMRRAAAWTTSAASRLHVGLQALQGALLGPAGLVLGGLGAGVAALDGSRQLVSVVRDTAPQGRVKASIGSLGKFAQAAGCVAAMAGLGLPAVGLIAGGLLASTLTA